MSHFCLSVIIDNLDKIESMMKPFDENTTVSPYITRTKEQIIEKAKERKANYLKEKECGKELSSWHKKYINANTDEELFKAERDEFGEYDEEGNELSSYNPNSKWDWYEIGGRFNNKLLVKENVNVEKMGNPSFFNLDSKYKDAPKGYKWCNVAKLKDIEFEKMSEFNNKYEKAIRFWEVNIEGKEPLTDEEKEDKKWCFYNPKYYIDLYKTKENYAKIESMFNTWAVLDEEGWHEKGKMGWFALNDATHESINDFIEKFNEILHDPKNAEKYLVIIDCHI